MDPNALKLALVSVIFYIGACHLLPPILDLLHSVEHATLDSIKKILATFGDFVVWFRRWRRETWPPRGAPRQTIDRAA